jgi:2,4-dienoyl-CoA reductase-like NADH-dependent reductase (Old Yellow Enzyme family)
MQGSQKSSAAAPVRLFEPYQLRGLKLKNRVVVSAMSMYSSQEGFSDDFHLVHIGRFALGGAGLVFMEASAVSPEGRITPGCNGLWDDAQLPALRRITDFLHRFGCAAGIQLGHSGAKGAARRPWHGGSPLDAEDQRLRGEQPWPVASASAEPFDSGWAAPHALSAAQIDELVGRYRDAARRARNAGFDALELHCAHGYLLHSFLSPLANKRDDQYGGSLENRMRLPLRIAREARAEWPAAKPLLVRISSVDGIGVGWSIEDSVAFAKALAVCGVDAIDCSSGGLRLPRERQVAARTPGFQVAFAARVRREAGIPTVAVGLILDPQHAEDILRNGDADLVSLAREALFNPNWPAQAALSLLGPVGWELWPEQFRWWLERRARQIDDPRVRKP